MKLISRVVGKRFSGKTLLMHSSVLHYCTIFLAASEKQFSSLLFVEITFKLLSQIEDEILMFEGRSVVGEKGLEV